MVLNAFGTSAFKETEERYNPYQQQPYQDQFNQQKRQQQMEYEQYEYEKNQRQNDDEDAQFAQTYGLPIPQKHSNSNSRHSSSVSFEKGYRDRYYDDDEDHNANGRMKRHIRKGGRKTKYNDLEGGDYRDRSLKRNNNGGESNGSGSGDDDDDDDSDDHSSVSSEDSDVKIVSLFI